MSFQTISSINYDEIYQENMHALTSPLLRTKQLYCSKHCFNIKYFKLVNPLLNAGSHQIKGSHDTK